MRVWPCWRFCVPREVIERAASIRQLLTFCLHNYSSSCPCLAEGDSENEGGTRAIPEARHQVDDCPADPRQHEPHEECVSLTILFPRKYPWHASGLQITCSFLGPPLSVTLALQITRFKGWRAKVTEDAFTLASSVTLALLSSAFGTP